MDNHTGQACPACGSHSISTFFDESDAPWEPWEPYYCDEDEEEDDDD